VIVPAAVLGLALFSALLKATDSNEKAPPVKGKPRPLVDIDAFLKEFDRNKDGSLSREELPRELHYNFGRLDANRDNQISKEELEKGVALLQQQRRPSDVVAILVEMSDCDECCMEEVQRAYDILRSLDTNKDGKVSAEEMSAGRTRLVRERVGGLIEELDENKDGKLSKEEARGQIRADFEQLDKNRDGFIDRDE